MASTASIATLATSALDAAFSSSDKLVFLSISDNLASFVALIAEIAASFSIANFLFCLPRKDGPDRVTPHKGIQQAVDAFLLPDKIPLNVREKNSPVIVLVNVFQNVLYRILNKRHDCHPSLL